MEIPRLQESEPSFPEKISPVQKYGNGVETPENSQATSFLYLRSSHREDEKDRRRTRREKNFVIRRIRERRRSKGSQELGQKASLRVGGGERYLNQWMNEDAFSFPWETVKDRNVYTKKLKFVILGEQSPPEIVYVPEFKLVWVNAIRVFW